MSDENTIIEDENEDLQSEIPSVGDDEAKRKNQIFIVGIIILSFIAAVLIYSAMGGDTSEKDDLEAKVEKEFEIIEKQLIVPEEKQSSEVITPSFKPEPVKVEPKGLLRRPEPAPIQPVVTDRVSSREAEQKAKKEQAMWDKRRKASTVVYNAATDQRPLTEQERAQNQRDRINQIVGGVKDQLSTVTGGSGGLSGYGADNNKDSLEGRLHASKPERITASYIEGRSHVIHQGTMIGCILETAISSELPGMVKCIVSEDVYSFDGSLKLIPKGSEVTGQYEGGIQHGESRIFAIWTRLITPTGISVQLDSPGTGALGRSGHSAWVDSHFLERFGSSALLSVIGGLAASEADGDVRLEEVGKSFNQSAEIALRESIKIRPTGHKNQGERIKIFVAKDIDFKPVLSLRR